MAIFAKVNGFRKTELLQSNNLAVLPVIEGRKLLFPKKMYCKSISENKFSIYDITSEVNYSQLLKFFVYKN